MSTLNRQATNPQSTIRNPKSPGITKRWIKGKSSKDARVKEIMTSSVVTITPDQSIEECMGLMTMKHIRHLPVLEDKKLVGMISIGDVVKAIISEQEHTIKDLENYITGGR